MKIKLLNTALLTVTLVFILANNCFSHYGMVIPSDNMIMQDEKRKIKVTLSFSHPFEGIGMELKKPKSFFVVKNGKKQDLAGELSPVVVMDNPAWTLAYPVKRPGAYAFVMEPAPYWESAEDCYIIHTTKTIVAAFGDDSGWDEEIGLKTEIIPFRKET